MILGNEALQASFSRMIAEDAVPNVILLVGPRGVGIEEFARSLTAQMLRVDIAKLPLNPDFFYAAHEDEKTFVPHTLEEIAGVGEQVVTKSLSGRRVVIIPDADLFTASVANTLLKTLEEAAPGTHFMLLASQSALILPTIKSRASVWDVAPASVGALREHFAAYVTKEYFEQVLQFSAGRVEMAQKLFTDTKARNAWIADQEFLTNAASLAPYARVALGEKMTPKGDHADKKAQLIERLARFQVLAAMLMKQDVRAAAAWGVWIDTLLETERALLHHGNPRLNIDNLLLALPRMA